jgi:hypothetical protein
MRHPQTDAQGTRVGAAPFFGALDALAVNDDGGGASQLALTFADLLVEGKVHAVEHSVTLPPHKPAMHHAVRRQVLGQSPSLAGRAQDIENHVDNLAHPRRVRAGFGVADKIWPDQIHLASVASRG